MNTNNPRPKRNTHCPDPIQLALSILALVMLPGVPGPVLAAEEERVLYAQSRDWVEPSEKFLRFLESMPKQPTVEGLCFECGKESVTYESWWDEQQYPGFQYSGRYVAVLVPEVWPENDSLDEEEIRFLVDRLDILYQHATELIGREPEGSGLLEAAFVENTCGAGCGWLGSKRLEVLSEDRRIAEIRLSIDSGLLPNIFLHEMLHNFDVYREYIQYSPMDPHCWGDMIQPYLAFYGRSGSSGGVAPYAHKHYPPEEYVRTWQQHIWEPYLFEGRLMDDPITTNDSADWQACVRDNFTNQACWDRGIVHSNWPWGGFGAAVGLLHGPSAMKQSFAFLSDFADSDPPPVGAENREDLRIQALSYGAGVNLGCYVDGWRWFASSGLRSWMETQYGVSAPMCADDDSDGYAEILYDCDDANPNISPGVVDTANGIDDDCDGLVDEHVYTGSTALQTIVLPAQVAGTVESGLGQRHRFAVNVTEPGPVAAHLCASPDLSGFLEFHDPDSVWLQGQGVRRDCNYQVYELDRVGQWSIEVGAFDTIGDYTFTVAAVPPWPDAWGRVEYPELLDFETLRLTAVTESLTHVADTPEQVRFWVSGYGVVGTVPYEEIATLDWRASPRLKLGSYTARAQLMKGDIPVSDVAPGTVFFTGEILYVVLESFTAEPTRGGVMVRWSTAAEKDNAGFRVLRRQGHRSAKLEVLTPRPLPARGSEVAGAQYEYFDPLKPQARVIQYFLEDIDVFGNTTRHGPVTVRLGTFKSEAPLGFDRTRRGR